MPDGMWWLRGKRSPKLKSEASPEAGDPSASIVVPGVVGAGVDVDELVNEDNGEADDNGEVEEDGKSASSVSASTAFLLLFRGQYRYSGYALLCFSFASRAIAMYIAFSSFEASLHVVETSLEKSAMRRRSH